MKRLKKKHLVIILCAVIALLGLLFAANKIYREYQARHENDDKTLFDGAVVIKHYHNTDYYISEKSYDGEHDIQTFWQEDLTGLDCTTVMNYTEYHQYCKRWELTEKYHDPDLNYIVLSRSRYCGNCAHAVLSGVEYNGSDATLYLWYDLYGNTDGNPGFVCIVPTDRPVTNVNLFSLYTEEELDYIKQYGEPFDVEGEP
jgi:hypothetical protein